MQSSTPTLARRYIFKLVANIASVPVYLVMEAILPRALGPQMYGNYSFATNLFQQLSGFLDMGTSTCFYNSLSRRQAETGLIGFFVGQCMKEMRGQGNPKVINELLVRQLNS